LLGAFGTIAYCVNAPNSPASAQGGQGK
jgi:hypothetical protein